MLVRLIYSSSVTGPVANADLRDILQASRRNNARDNITGMLCAGNARFIQCVEGERDLVNALYDRLMHDRRHRDLVILGYRAIDERMFHDWSMGFVSLFEPHIYNVICQAGMTTFLPEDLEDGAAVELMGRLKSVLEPQYVVDTLDRPAEDLATRH